MRIWHKDLVEILPSHQLVAQWRECVLIAKEICLKGTPNHILVNKVINYPLEHLATYCNLVRWNMKKRGYDVNILAEEKLTDYLEMSLDSYVPMDILFDGWHNEKYLWQCLYNLEEKYDCGGITPDEWKLIDEFTTYYL